MGGFYQVGDAVVHGRARMCTKHGTLVKVPQTVPRKECAMPDLPHGVLSLGEISWVCARRVTFVLSILALTPDLPSP